MGVCCTTGKLNLGVQSDHPIDSRTKNIIYETPILRSYQRQIAAEPLNGRLYASFGKMLYRMGVVEYAIIQLKKSMALNSADGEVYLILSEIYSQKEDMSGYVHILKEGLEKHSSYAPLIIRLSEYCANIGDYQGAYQLALRGLRLEEDELLYYLIGLYHFKAGEYQKSLFSFKEALKLCPSHYKCHNGIGNVYRKLGRCDEAIQSYIRCEQLSKGVFPFVFLNLGSMYFSKENISLAVMYFQKAYGSGDHLILSILSRKGYMAALQSDVIYEGILLYYKSEYSLSMQKFQDISLSKNIVVNYFMGQSCKKMERRGDALIYYKQVLVEALDEENQAKPFLRYFINKTQYKVEKLLQCNLNSRVEPEESSKDIILKHVNEIDSDERIDKFDKIRLHVLPNKICTRTQGTDSLGPSTSKPLFFTPIKEIPFDLQSEAKNTVKNFDFPMRTSSYYEQLRQENKCEIEKEMNLRSSSETHQVHFELH